MIFIDTSYLIALAMDADALHDRALAWSRILPGPFLTTEYVVCEFMNALSAPANRPAAHSLLRAIHSNPQIEVMAINEAMFSVGVALHADRPDKSWSLTDCISFHAMGQNGLTDSLSHDRHFEQAGFHALLRNDPPG
jgi:uncharacterized protein